MRTVSSSAGIGSRWVGVLLGLLAMVFLCAEREAGAADARAGFVGAWCNVDFQTGDVTRVLVWMDGDEVKVKMWGRCHPTECDWGVTTGTLKDGALLLKWDHGFATRDQSLTLRTDGTLQMKGQTHYKPGDGRPDQSSSEVYSQKITHDWSDPNKGKAKAKK